MITGEVHQAGNQLQGGLEYKKLMVGPTHLHGEEILEISQTVV